jgi:putative endopeptidase
LKIAYLAFLKTPQGKSGQSANPPKIDGFTPDQRFFLAFGQIWRWKISPEFSRILVNADPHSPNPWRVYGPLVNFPPFVAAFGKPGDTVAVKPGSGSVSIW